MTFNAPHNIRNAMVDHQAMDKDKVPFQTGSNMTTQRPTKTNKVPTINLISNWLNESLETTMDVIEHGSTSLERANKFWCIPITSLSDHLNEKIKSRQIRPLCTNKRKRSSCCCMGFKYVGMWVLYNTTTTQMEGGRSYSN